MKLELDDIARCLQLLLAHARKWGITYADASDVDMYWTTTSDDWFVQLSGEPAQAVGSLHDDMVELKKLLADPARVTSVDLDRLASVLRLLSCQISGDS